MSTMYTNTAARTAIANIIDTCHWRESASEDYSIDGIVGTIRRYYAQDTHDAVIDAEFYAILDGPCAGDEHVFSMMCHLAYHNWA